MEPSIGPFVRVSSDPRDLVGLPARFYGPTRKTATWTHGRQKYIRQWPFWLFLEVLGNFVAYFWGPGKDHVEMKLGLRGARRRGESTGTDLSQSLQSTRQCLEGH